MATTKGIDKYNMIQMLNSELERSIKVASVDAITKKMVAEYEAQIRPAIKEEVEKMVFSSINHIQDMMQVRDEFRLYIRWCDEEDKRTITSS